MWKIVDAVKACVLLTLVTLGPLLVAVWLTH